MLTATVGKVIVSAKIENVFDLYEAGQVNGPTIRSAALMSPMRASIPARPCSPCQSD